MIPTHTTPLTKAIRTLEGQLVIVSDVVLAVASAFDPSALPPKYAAIVATVQHVALLIQRGVIKSSNVTDVVTSASVVVPDAEEFAAAPTADDIANAVA